MHRAGNSQILNSIEFDILLQKQGFFYIYFDFQICIITDPKYLIFFKKIIIYF